MTNDDAFYIRHIRDAIQQIQGYVRGVDESEFMNDEILQDAVIRQLSIVGEAVGQTRSGKSRLQFRGPTFTECGISSSTTTLVSILKLCGTRCSKIYPLC